jgi:hypothetical protein
MKHKEKLEQAFNAFSTLLKKGNLRAIAHYQSKLHIGKNVFERLMLK